MRGSIKCQKCGATWSSNNEENNGRCPFCGEYSSEGIPFEQCINIFNGIIRRFGVNIYTDEERLIGIINDLIPVSFRERNILNTAISFGIAKSVCDAFNSSSLNRDFIDEMTENMMAKGIERRSTVISIYIIAYPLGIDIRKTDLFKNYVSDASEKIDLPVKKLEDYSYLELKELKEMSNNGDAEASYEIANRYFEGIDVEVNYNESIIYYKRAALSGCVEAKYILGYIYENACGVEKDVYKAYNYYKDAANEGNAEAQYSLGNMLYQGSGCDKNDMLAIYWIKKSLETLDEPFIYLTLSMILANSEDETVNDEKQAFKYINKAVELGDKTAINILGTFYEKGLGVKQDYNKAFDCYFKAYENGVEASYINVGACFQYGCGVEKNLREAAKFYMMGANCGNKYCLNALGMCYKNGSGVEKDLSKSLELFLEAAYAGNYAAAFNVGLAYDEGYGVEVNRLEAHKWFLISANEGFGKAMFSLGVYEELGFLGEIDNQKALSWYKKAAENDDYDIAQYVLGNCRCYGLIGSYVDKLEAFEWYLKAAQKGHATAQNNVACEYYKGYLVEQDIKEALYWFEKSVEQNDPFALNNYGEIMINGDGVSQNVERGFELIKRSAEQDNLDAKLNLGICYFEAWGVQRNLELALKYLSEVYYETQNEKAKEYLEKGFKYKNGIWVKKGIFTRIPEPNRIPTPMNIPEYEGGCVECKHCDSNAQLNKKIYCKYIGSNVYVKEKCRFYAE